MEGLSMRLPDELDGRLVYEVAGIGVDSRTAKIHSP